MMHVVSHRTVKNLYRPYTPFVDPFNPYGSTNRIWPLLPWNILSPTNEMRFTDRKTFFTDRIPLLSIRLIRTDRQTVYNSSCHENIPSPTYETVYPCCRSVRSVRIDTWLIRTVTVRVYWTTLRQEENASGFTCEKAKLDQALDEIAGEPQTYFRSCFSFSEK